jgi:hypothetical protein
MVVLCVLAAVVFLRLLGICYIRYIAPWRKEMLEARKGELGEQWERQGQDIRRQLGEWEREQEVRGGLRRRREEGKERKDEKETMRRVGVTWLMVQRELVGELLGTSLSLLGRIRTPPPGLLHLLSHQKKEKWQ